MSLNFRACRDVLCVVRSRRSEYKKLAVSLVVFGVLGVPVFAQSDDRASLPDPSVRAVLRADRTTAGVVRIYANVDTSVGRMSPPANLTVPPALRPLVDAMLRKSPTFRRQCMRIADAVGLNIVFEYVQTPTELFRARAIVSRTPDGRRTALVQLRTLDDAVELVAHEIEHVIEQLDGIDLHARAAVPTSGVHVCDCGTSAFETERAIRVGQRVAEEVRRQAP
jgi:hypothetical protein